MSFRADSESKLQVCAYGQGNSGWSIARSCTFSVRLMKGWTISFSTQHFIQMVRQSKPRGRTGSYTSRPIAHHFLLNYVLVRMRNFGVDELSSVSIILRSSLFGALLSQESRIYIYHLTAYADVLVVCPKKENCLSLEG